MTGRLTLTCFVALFALALLPLLSVSIPPLFDYPNHLGRMSILAARGHDGVLNRYYAIRWGILPNLGMDSLVPWLSGILPLFDAGRVFLVGTLLVLASGPVLLYRVWWGKWSPWPCVGFLFLYSRVFLWGFISYLAGIGLALLVLAGWVLLQKGSWVIRGMAGALAVTIVFFCHLEAFGVLALLLLGVELPLLFAASGRRDLACLGTRVAGLMMALLPATLLFLFVWQPHAGAGLTLPRLDRKPDLLFSVFDNYSRPFDILCFVLCLGGAIFMSVRGYLRIAPPAIWPIFLIGMLYLALPSMLFTGAGADHRLPLVLFLLLSGATDPSGLSRRHLGALAACLALLFLGRMAVIEKVWLQSARTYARDLAMLERLPLGTRLAVAAPASAVRVSAAPEYHFPVLAVPLRHAFVPTLFAFPTQQPVALMPGWRELAAQTDPDRVWQAFQRGDKSSLLLQRFVVEHFDAIVFVGEVGSEPLRSRCLIRLDNSQTVSLYLIDPVKADCR